MSGMLSKAFKWGASALRVAKVRFVAEFVRVGDDTLFGPNVQVYDREHEFNREGVSSELFHATTFIARCCWLCANVVVTCGCAIANRSLASANSVITRDLLEEGALCTLARLHG